MLEQGTECLELGLTQDSQAGINLLRIPARDIILTGDKPGINVLHTAVHHRTIDARTASTFEMKY